MGDARRSEKPPGYWRDNVFYSDAMANRIAEVQMTRNLEALMQAHRGAEINSVLAPPTGPAMVPHMLNASGHVPDLPPTAGGERPSDSGEPE